MVLDYAYQALPEMTVQFFRRRSDTVAAVRAQPLEDWTKHVKNMEDLTSAETTDLGKDITEYLSLIAEGPYHASMSTIGYFRKGEQTCHNVKRALESGLKAAKPQQRSFEQKVELIKEKFSKRYSMGLEHLERNATSVEDFFTRLADSMHSSKLAGELTPAELATLIEGVGEPAKSTKRTRKKRNRKSQSKRAEDIRSQSSNPIDNQSWQTTSVTPPAEDGPNPMIEPEAFASLDDDEAEQGVESAQEEAGKSSDVEIDNLSIGELEDPPPADLSSDIDQGERVEWPMVGLQKLFSEVAELQNPVLYAQMIGRSHSVSGVTYKDFPSESDFE